MMKLNRTMVRLRVDRVRLNARSFGKASMYLASLTLALMLQAGNAGELARISQILNYNTGPLGQAENVEGWKDTSGNIMVTAGSGSLDGTALGLTASRGDRADINATAAFEVYNLFAPTSGQFHPGVRRNLYYSFLYRFNDAADVSDTSEVIIQANRQNAGSQYTLQGVARSVTGKLQIGVLKRDGTASFAPKQIDPGETVFVVFRHQIIPPAGADDVVDVWVNPPPASFGMDENITPSPDPHATSTDGTEDNSTTGPGRFYLASGANASFDELRIGTNWADVTPSAAVCDAAAVTQEPVDATVTAGIPARFEVKAAGTAPLFQWQSSLDGTSWKDVTNGTGGTLATYTTPFTTVADTGRKFRAIVTVTCGAGSSATSAVATLTVQPASPTPPGLVLSDTWTNDLSVSTPPVSTNNSVWFASSAGSLYIDPANNTMIAAPVAGSSTLWVGYFTEDTNSPVHLDVGRMLKAAIKFKPSGTSATGGNLRIGLFDYADGGTRLDRDGFGSGSSGNGQNVRGYMLGVNFSTAFSANTPLTLYARKGLESVNLMGSTGDYQSLGSGPAGLDLLGAPGIQDDTEYVLELSVERTNTVGVVVTASITGGGTNWTHTVADSTYNYHRFDAFGIRPNTQETTATWLEILQFKAEVIETTAPPPTPIPLTINVDGNEMELSWTNSAFVLEAAAQASGPYSAVAGASSPHRVTVTTGQQFFRLRAGE